MGVGFLVVSLLAVLIFAPKPVAAETPRTAVQKTGDWCGSCGIQATTTIRSRN
jgi:hypothetical protein